MNNGDDIDAIRQDPIDNAIRSLKQFAQVVTPILRDFSTGMRNLANLD